MPDSRKLIDRINSTLLTKEDIVRVVEECQKGHESGSPSDMLGMYTIAELYRGDFEKASAIYFRMFALAQFLEEEGAPAWTFKTDDGSYMAEDSVFAATALHPLVERDNDLVFDRKTFLDRVLLLSEVEGEEN